MPPNECPGIFAAGDVARWPDPHSGENIRVEHWVVAERQGPVVCAPEKRHGVDMQVIYVRHAETWDTLQIDGSVEAQDCRVAFRRAGRTTRCGDRPWRDRIIVVTGSTSGIGRQFAIHFAAEGAKVIACGRNDMALRKLQTEHPTIEAVECDVTARPNVLALVETIRDRYGMLDVLVNNAGIMERVDLLEESVSDERIAHEIAVNLTGPILLTRRLLPLLRSGRSPMIVMVTSGYALLPATRAPTYSATKAGLRSFTLALRRQLRGVGIRVVEVLPPLVDTPATRTVSKAKMSPAALVDQVMHDISHGKDEILPGKVRLLPMLMRLAPSLTARLVAES